MDRSSSVPRPGSAVLIPPAQGQSYRPTGAPSQFSNSQMKFMNDLVQQQPNSQRQAVSQQLEQLTPEEISEIQRKLENGEILHGLSALPEGANMTHKFIVKVRKHNQPAQPVKTTPPPPPPQKYAPQYCPDCLNKDQKLKQQDAKIEQLLDEMNKMSKFLVDKSQEIEIWKRQYMAIQQDLSKPKVIDNSDKYLKEINDLKNKLNQKENEIQSLETNIKQIQENQDQIELRGGNNDDGELEQLQKELYDAKQEMELYKEDNDRLNYKLSNMEAQLQNRKTEVTTIYKSDPETERQLRELQSKYSLLQSQYYTISEQSKTYQKEIQYETKIIYQPDPETERQLQELKQKYTLLQSQYYTLQETSKIVQKEIQYETKVIYQSDPETEKLLQKKIQQYEELYARYTLIQDQYTTLQQRQQTTVYETKTIYQTDPETERQLQIKIDQYNQLQSRYNQLQNQFYSLEERSKIVQKEIQYETKVVYQPDPETERLLKMKTQQLESMTTRCNMLQEQIETTRIQIEQYQTRIYSFESRKSDSENYLIQIEQLKDQLRRANADIEQYTRKIYQLESNNEQITFLKKQISDLKLQYEQEQQLTFQLKRRIEEMKAEQSQYEVYQFKIRELEVLLQQKEDRIRQIQLESDQYRSEMITYQQRISSYQINIDNNEGLKQQIQQWREKYEQLEQRQRYQINEEVNQWKIRYEQIEQRYISLQQSYETIQITLNQYQDNEQSEVLKLEIKRLQKTIVELRSEIDRLLVQASDNQWLSKRYEEQQLLIEQFKSQLEERQSVQREYTYEIQNLNQKNEHTTSTSQKIVTTQQQYTQDSKAIYPQMTQQTKTIEYSSVQPKINEYSSYSSRPIEYTSVQQRQSYQQSQFLQPSQIIMNEQKRSRVEQEFSSQRWNDNYEVVLNEVTQKEKQFS
ncbi:unnamed protein product (macronuclear) [Paramecium tetraurelia]|uniref:Uncharacterized protein n=1 Tax=Paramecium tetraurelia TaxID=5888 RepID=A0DLY7_PARTE|nr:uncharacterized protein GSPATT00018272001 [Paramecium tetraurelia]CAK84054.1 unnamed protein product [Paramecium tetraurelia]|eukprot:XP_001451451.1 hypothetical protein (macronuclear) [Paramecium tetraurelia strain d4-2]